MSTPSDDTRRPDVGRALARDLSLLARREKGTGTFWRSLGVLGMVGWPIALLAVGGVFLGRMLDSRLGTGVHFTLILLALGIILGSFVARGALRGLHR